MKREDVLVMLSNHKRELTAKYGLVRLGIFGSTARNEATEFSDIDIVVEMPPDAYQMVHMKDELEAIFSGSIDLIRYNRFLNSRLRERIDREAIYV
ncbi:MAG: nucleotidyltransferase domain-containing protein [Caldilineaceae bacterium]|nr:nucleotidyltransferase domain-containing protein [Caldilineaceae bacterium]